MPSHGATAFEKGERCLKSGTCLRMRLRQGKKGEGVKDVKGQRVKRSA